MPDNFKELQRRLGIMKRARLGTSPSNRELAGAVGASPTTVSAWLRGEQFPQTFEPLRKILELVHTQAVRQDRLAVHVDSESGETIAELLNRNRWEAAYEAERRRRSRVSREANERHQAQANLLRDGPVSVVVPSQNITVELPSRISPALSGLPHRARETFVGRDHLVQELLTDLAPDTAARPRSALMTLLAGMGGVGKTEVAVHTATAARDMPGWFPGGVLLIDLFGYDSKRRLSVEQALDNLLRTLGMGEHIPADLQSRIGLYCSVLAGYAEQGRRILVVLDNACTADQVAPLLPNDGFTAVVITSRHTLGTLGVRLRDLDALDEETSSDLVRRALVSARGEADTRVADAPADAAALARLCGGLPLALRMCSAQLAAAPTRPLASLVSALDEARTRLDRLGPRRGDHAVRAAFELSYQQLDGDQARMFHLLSLNPGPDVSTETAAHLMAGNAHDTEALLGSLEEAHLVESRDLYGRWRMHDLVRVFAYEYATAAPTAEADRDRLLVYYRDRSKQADAYVLNLRNTTPRGFTDRRHALDWLDAEHDNLLAAAALADTTGRARVAFDLAMGIEEHLATNRYFKEWCAMAEVAVRSARNLRHGVCSARAHVALSDALRKAGAIDDAMRAAHAAADLYRDLKDRPGEGSALRALAAALSADSRHEEAIAAGRAGSDLLRLGPNQHYVGVALMNLGLDLAEVERHDEAIAALREALTILSRTSYSVEGVALGNLGSVLLSADRPAEAIDELQLAVARCRRAGSRWDLCNAGRALANLAEAWEREERYDDAVIAWEQAVAHFKESGETILAGLALAELGTSLTAQERHDKALKPLQEAIELLCGPTSQPGETTSPDLASALASAAEALHTIGQREKACRAYGEAVDIWRRLTDGDQDEYQLYMARALLLLSQARFETGALMAAREPIAEAVAIFRRLAESQPEIHAAEFQEALSIQADIN